MNLIASGVVGVELLVELTILREEVSRLHLDTFASGCGLTYSFLE